jgi:hypothetical protein
LLEKQPELKDTIKHLGANMSEIDYRRPASNFRYFTLIFSWTLVLPFSFAANSATISISEDADLSCRIFVDGEILAGDAERLRQTIEDLRSSPEMRDFWGNSAIRGNRFRVCFNSPGGAYLEGIEIARVLSNFGGGLVFGTAVPANSICESACALAFMGGTETNESARLATDRILHPTGRLGFHAPALPIPEGNYSRQEVNRAYEIALESIARIVQARNSFGYDFPESLFEKMLETPQSDFFYIDTLADAEFWGINVHSTGVYAASTEEISRNICEAADSRLHNIYLGENQGYSHVPWEISITITREQVIIPTGFGPGFDPGHLMPCTLDFRNFDWSEDSILGGVTIRDLLLNEPFNLHDIRPVMTFPSDTRIAQIPALPQISIAEFRDRFSSDPVRQLSSATNSSSRNLVYDSFWDHNGSRMGMVASGRDRMLYYAAPRLALVERGVTPGRLLFEGERVGNRYVGTARIFAATPCGEYTYRVEGPVSADQRTITMYGRAPRVNDRCEVTGYRDDTLVFSLE